MGHISLSGSGLGVRVTTISPTAAGKAATAGLKAIPYVAAGAGFAIDTYQDYNIADCETLISERSRPFPTLNAETP